METLEFMKTKTKNFLPIIEFQRPTFTNPNSTKSQANQKINFPQIIFLNKISNFSRAFKANTKMTLRKVTERKLERELQCFRLL
jgi:hypothetical protein